MSEEQYSLSAKSNLVDNSVQQKLGLNQGQVVGQMTNSKAVSAQEIGVFVSGGSVVFQNGLNSHLQAISKKERSIPSLLPYLPNRSDQEFELGQKIQAHFQQSAKSPFVCIVHGDEFQSQDMFLERLQKVSLPRMLKLDTTENVIKAYCLPWPSGVKELEKIPEYLCKNLADSVEGYSFASAENINQTFCKYPAPIIVHTHLLTGDWECQGEGIIPKLLDFWNNWPELVPSQKIIVCIFIKYQVKRRKSTGFLWFLRPLKLIHRFMKHYRCCKLNQKISQQLYEISQLEFSQFERLNGVVLPKLSGISRTHVENWVRAEMTKEFIGEAKLEQLIHSVRDMFNHWESQTSSNTIPMDDLAEQLIELLKLQISTSD